MNKNKNKLNREKLSLKTKQIIPQIYLWLLIVVAVIFLGVIYRAYTPVAGQAIFTKANVPIGPIDFNAVPENSLQIGEDVYLWHIALTTSQLKVSSEYTITTQISKDKETIQYIITNSNNSLIVVGLLSEEFFDSGEIYLDEDDLPDLRLTYSQGFLKIFNLNYLLAAQATITLIDPAANNIITSKVVPVVINKPIGFWFNVTSNKVLLVTAAWKNGTSLTPAEFSTLATGNNYTTMAFKFTPKEEAAYVIKVTASVDDKNVTQDYIFASGNIIYALIDTSLPELILKKRPGIEEYNFTFNFKPNKDQKQPFSLPCGELNLTANPIILSNLTTIYAYDNSVQQWKSELSSELNEFNTLEWKKGYLLQLKNGEPFSVTISCNMTSSESQLPPKVFELPALKAGWNLVGITGYEPRAIKNLIAPTGKKISYVFVLSNDGVNLDNLIAKDKAELEPGKAYWVLVE